MHGGQQQGAAPAAEPSAVLFKASLSRGLQPVGGQPAPEGVAVDPHAFAQKQEQEQQCTPASEGRCGRNGAQRPAAAAPPALAPAAPLASSPAAVAPAPPNAPPCTTNGRRWFASLGADPQKPQVPGTTTNGGGGANGGEATNGTGRHEPQGSPPPAWASLPQKGAATSELCCFCFQVLRAHLQGQPPPAFPTTADPAFRAPLFVTWLKQRRGGLSSTDLEIRGCIGCLEPIVLSPGLSEYALRSSLQDKRFPPVQLDEVPSLTCKLSILHGFEACSHVNDWQIGVHGVLIRFQGGDGKQYSATYLPEVAREHGMTREVAIRELVVKAGYGGPCDTALLQCLEVTRYQTTVETVAYWEYLCCAGATER